MQEKDFDKPDYNAAHSEPSQGGRDYRYDYEGDKLINDPAALTIAIVSLVVYFMGCICYGLPSIFTLTGSIIAWVMANKAISVYEADPSRYSRNSYKSINAGRIIGIIGTFLSGITVLVWIVIMIFFGAIFSQALEGEFDLEDLKNRDLQDSESYEEDVYETTDDDWEYQEDEESIEGTDEIIEYEESPVDSI